MAVKKTTSGKKGASIKPSGITDGSGDGQYNQVGESRNSSRGKAAHGQGTTPIEKQYLNDWVNDDESEYWAKTRQKQYAQANPSKVEKAHMRAAHDDYVWDNKAGDEIAEGTRKGSNDRNYNYNIRQAAKASQRSSKTGGGKSTAASRRTQGTKK